ncbi:regulatory protein, luxR family [Rheinheimera pacifica]|uniref:Regulatory protein, luxR family n=1 Tax=Rheinheimera pacifica TaxID=173990 RepID=A0A1H6KJF8_9GAMM|nr:helix-turn-helix transcriptional regulator [Rheinheimera pacifica]SEH73479.1 regulatory protein, luxR family [Rheinheimera pacifica]
MSDLQPNTLLAEAISAINTIRFTSTLMQLLGGVCSFDSAVILGYSSGKHPVYLYDSLESSRHLLFQCYLTSTFQQDPFYHQLLTRQHGIFSLSQVTDKHEHKDYLRKFYAETGWKDELCLAINIGPGRDVLIFLGVTDINNRFTANHIALLERYFPVLKVLCQQHWQQAAFNLAQPLDEVVICHTTMRHYLDESLQTFAQAVLTKREQQIASLLVQGADSTEIAGQLGLSVGTVKNHRKKIYAQLHIKSISELFQLFINHLLTHSFD